MKESVERLTLGEKQTSDWDGSKERSELKGGHVHTRCLLLMAVEK